MIMKIAYLPDLGMGAETPGNRVVLAAGPPTDTSANRRSQSSQKGWSKPQPVPLQTRTLPVAELQRSSLQTAPGRVRRTTPFEV